MTVYTDDIARLKDLKEAAGQPWAAINPEYAARMRAQNQFKTGLDIARYTAAIMRKDIGEPRSSSAAPQTGEDKSAPSWTSRCPKCPNAQDRKHHTYCCSCRGTLEPVPKCAKSRPRQATRKGADAPSPQAVVSSAPLPDESISQAELRIARAELSHAERAFAGEDLIIETLRTRVRGA